VEGVLEVASPASPAPLRARDERGDERSVLAVAALFVLLPVALGWVVWQASFSDGGDPNLRVAVAPADVVSLGLLGWWVARFWRSVVDQVRRPRSLLATVTVALGAVLLVALVAHPSPRGVELAVRVVAAAATADLIRRIEGAAAQRRVLGVVVVVGVVQAVLAMAQSVNGGPLGPAGLELDGPLYPFGSSFAGRGGLGHPYHLACLLAVACGAAALGVRRHARPGFWAAGLAICATGIGVTFSRTGVLGLAAVVVVGVVGGLRRHDRRCALVVGAVVVGLAVGMAAFGDGWTTKSAASVDGEQVDSGRRARAAEAIDLTAEHPLVGVGPGRYVIALEQTGADELLPAHNLALHEAAEGGLVAGVLAACAFGLLALRSFGRGTDALLVFLPLAPFFVLDAFPYAFGVGLALSGIWLGLLSAPWSGTDADVAV